MTRAQRVRAVAAAAFAVTLACAWFLLPGRVEVALGETAPTLDRWQYVLGAGLVGWAFAAGAGGTGLALGSLARMSRPGTDGSGRTAGPGDLGTWAEAGAFVLASVVVWVQVVLGGPGPG